MIKHKKRGNFQAKLGYALHIMKYEDRAWSHYVKAYEKGCSLPAPMSAYGLMLLRRGEYEKALEVLRYTRTMKLDANQWGFVYQNLGLTYWKLGQIDRAVEIFKKIFERLQTVSVYGTLGFLLIAQGDITGNYAEALEFNRKAYDYDNEDASIVDNLGQVQYRLGNIEEAEKFFLKAVSIKSTQFDTLYYLAKIRYEQGNKEEATNYINRALERDESTLSTVPRSQALDLRSEIGKM